MKKKERNKKIITMREDGSTFQEIADIYGISRERVSQTTSRHGVVVKSQKEQRNEKIVKLRMERMTYQEIANRFELTRERVRQIISEASKENTLLDTINKELVKQKRKEHIFVNGYELKECSKCKEYKELLLFSKDKNIWDGLASVCKSCRKKYSNENRERLAKYTKEFYDSLTPEIQRKNYLETSSNSCSKCGFIYRGVYEEAFNYFYKWKQSLNGLSYHCKECLRKERKEKGRVASLISTKCRKHQQRQFPKYFSNYCLFTGEELVKGNVHYDHVRPHSSFNNMNRKETGFIGNILRISKFANRSKSNTNLLDYALREIEDKDLAHQIVAYIIEALRAWYNRQNKVSVSFEDYYRFIVDYDPLNLGTP